MLRPADESSTVVTARDGQTVKAAFDTYRDEVMLDTVLYRVDLGERKDRIQI